MVKGYIVDQKSIRAEFPDPMSELRPVHIGLRFRHHSGHSGYHRLSDYVGNVRTVHDALADEKVNVRRASLSTFGKLTTALRGFVRPAELQLFPGMMLGFARVYHFLYAENSYLYSSLASRGNSRIICSFHQPVSWFHERWKGLRSGFVRSAYRKIDVAIALGSSQVPILREIVGEGRVEVIHHGIDTNFFSPRQADAERPIILTVGSWFRNYDLLLSVARRVLEVRPDVRFRIVASRSAISTEEYPENIEYMTGISDNELLQQYHEAVVMYLPLRGSVANNALLEAMAMGIPVVVSRTGDVEEYTGKSSGIVLDDDDVENHVAALFRMLDDSQLRLTSSRGARRRAEELSWEAIASQMRDVYVRSIHVE